MTGDKVFGLHLVLEIKDTTVFGYLLRVHLNFGSFSFHFYRLYFQEFFIAASLRFYTGE